MLDSFRCLSTMTLDDKEIQFFDLNRLPNSAALAHLPFSLKILLENLLRLEDNISVSAKDIEALLSWDPKQVGEKEIAFTPSRVLLQDFTGVPVVVDLAAMRDAMQKLDKDPKKINPLAPVELIIDHSVMADYFGTPASFQENVDIEFERNRERYAFLRWGQTAFGNFRVVPPGTGICHQVNLEYLARIVFCEKQANGKWLAYPDTLMGTDSHTTMVNALGVLGWGVGGIEAEAAMLGQPGTLLIPEVIGFKLTGKLSPGATATDLVLTVTHLLRKKGVVNKFVEFFGEGLDHLPLADRATISNMSPEFGATCAMFPIDQETLNYLQLTGRSKKQLNLIEQYAKKQGLFRDKHSPEAKYNEVITLDLSRVEPCVAGPKRPQDQVLLREMKNQVLKQFETQNLSANPQRMTLGKESVQLDHGSVVIAAITSCTNTSNPSVLLGAGLLAKKAVEAGLKVKPWVKTSLAPGSQVVTDYLNKAGLTPYLDKLGFYLVGYGCTTCIGNSGPLPMAVSEAIKNGNLTVSAVLSGNRNFEGRIHPEVRDAYLASPLLVVAFALAGRVNIDFEKEPIGENAQKKPIYLKDIWPSLKEIQDEVNNFVEPQMFTQRYASVFEGDEQWKQLKIPKSELFDWDDSSTYVRNPPYFEDMNLKPDSIQSIQGAYVLAKLGDSVTTDHISPAGNIAKNSPAAEYLMSHGVKPHDFNSYGSRRGNHEVMLRGTFANIRLRNALVPEREGNWTKYMPDGEIMTIYDASKAYQKKGYPLIILAGKEYGSGSSRDWAAKGTALLGVRAVIAESYERIHRANLVGMGILPLQFLPNQSADSLGLLGTETFDIDLAQLKPRGKITVKVHGNEDKSRFEAQLRIDTPKELDYFQNGGILPYVVRELAKTE